MSLKSLIHSISTMFLVITTLNLTLVEAYPAESQVIKNFLQMTIKTKRKVVVGESTKIIISINNLGNETFTFFRYPLSPDSVIWIKRIETWKSGKLRKPTYSLHYRMVDLFTGIWAIWVPLPREIKPMEERIEVHYAKFLKPGRYKIKAMFWYSDNSLIVTTDITVGKAHDIKVSLKRAIKIANESRVKSLIRSESLRNPIWLLGFPYIAVDAKYGNVSKIRAIMDWQILEMLEHQSPDKYMKVIISSYPHTFSYTMIKQLEELGVKNIKVLSWSATALIPCDYNKIIEIGQLQFVNSISSLMGISK